MQQPDTPLLDAIRLALLDWQEANAGRPVLAVDPDTYNAVTDEAHRLAWWSEVERGQPSSEPSGLSLYVGYEAVITVDVDGWEWRRD